MYIRSCWASTCAREHILDQRGKFRHSGFAGGEHFFVDVPGAMPVTGFTSSGASGDDTVGTVNIPVTMTLPPGWTNWLGDQVFYCEVDERSTAQYAHSGCVPEPRH